MYAGGQTIARRAAERRGPVSWRDFGLSLALHLAVFALFWGIAKLAFRRPDTIIPMDLTIVPPWAEQTDDPDPDPNPPPPEAKAEPKPPRPEPEPPKIEEARPVEAVEKVVEKPKPKKEKPKPPDLRKNAKLVKAAPVADLRAKATKVEPPPNVRTYGKGTAADKPLSPEEFQRLMNQGYRIGARNQIANDETTRCVSLVAQAIRREWDKESFKWHPGLQALQIELQLGPGGRVQGFRIISGSGDGEVDRTARSALNRLKSIPGLSADFLRQFATLDVKMEPTAR